MKASLLPLFTLREDPKEAKVASHRLLLRAGYIRQEASGFYSFLPFGYMVFRKIEQIVREEMNAHGGVEVHLPVLTPKELWEESGRWELMGKEMMRLVDRHGHWFALGPTHEEAMTALAREFLKSYKQLPLNLYQIGIKYRDEIRPRYGLIRAREFVMKDAYSFHLTEESLEETYQKMRQAYRQIFERCGLSTIAVEADSGAMGGSGSEEFMVASQIGEETLLLCQSCGFKSNQEKTAFVPKNSYLIGKEEFLEKIPTPDQKTVAEVSKIIQKEAIYFIKAVVYETDQEVLLAFIPGDRELCEVKLKNLAKGLNFSIAKRETILKVCGAEPGFVGPVNLKFMDGEKVALAEENGKVQEKTIRLFFDENLRNRHGLVAGANETHYHFRGISYGRDFSFAQGYDLVKAEGGDLCPKCQKDFLQETKGIEVGHVFKLGKKYSEAMKLQVLDEKGVPVTLFMGCYGIGLGRTLQTIVEQNHDEKGIIWPVNISPFTYYLISLAKTEEEKRQASEIYETLQKNHISVYWDDREERPGVKFADADLVGFPYQIIVGKTYFSEGKLELKDRRTGKRDFFSLEQILERNLI